MAEKMLAIGKHTESADLHFLLIEIYRRLGNAEPTSTLWKKRLAASLINAGVSLAAAKSNEHAMKCFDEGLALQSDLVKAEPDNSETTRDLVSYLSRTLYPIYAAYQVDKARQNCLELLSQFDAYAKEHTLDIRWRHAQAQKKSSAAGFFHFLGDIGHAAYLYQGNLDLMRALTAEHPANLEWKYEIALTLTKVIIAGSLGRIEQNLKESILLLDELVAADPTNLTWQFSLLETQRQLGLHYQRRKQPIDAYTYLEQAAQRLSWLVGLNPTNRWWLYNLPFVYKESGDAALGCANYQQATTWYEKTLEAMQVLVEFDGQDSCYIRLGPIAGLAACSAAQGDYEQALAYRKFVVQTSRNSKDDAWRLAESLIELGDTQAEMGDFANAYASVHEALYLAAGFQEWIDYDLAKLHSLLALYAGFLGDSAKAVVHGVNAVRLLYSDNQPDVVHVRLANAYVLNNQFDKARNIYLKYKGKRIYGGDLWEKTVLDALARFRVAGIEHPDFAKVGTLLGVHQ